MDLMLQKYLEFRNGLTNEEGQTMAEYGLLLALIAVVVMAAVLLLGPKIAGVFTNVTNQLPAAT